MTDIEGRKKIIFEQVGEQGLQILRESGIDVDSAVTRILQQQVITQKGLEALAASGDVNNMMTSELAYKSASPQDVYGQEFTRRLRSIGLTNELVSSLYQTEQLILSVNEKLVDERKQPWVRRHFILPDSTPEKMPAKGFLTLSELILITDDASSAFVRDHHILSEQAWSAVCMAAVQSHSYGGAQYAMTFKDRVKKFGWSTSQDGAFTKNECLLTERLKWGYTDKPAWTPETCDLKLY